MHVRLADEHVRVVALELGLGVERAANEGVVQQANHEEKREPCAQDGKVLMWGDTKGDCFISESEGKMLVGASKAGVTAMCAHPDDAEAWVGYDDGRMRVFARNDGMVKNDMQRWGAVVVQANTRGVTHVLNGVLGTTCYKIIKKCCVEICYKRALQIQHVPPLHGDIRRR